MEIKNLPLSLVKPSPMNPRKTFDQEGLDELAANIEKQGLLQPITVRPTIVENSNDIHYEIVCGERRYRAMCILSDKWKDMDSVAPKGETYNRFNQISAIVKEMSDAEAFDAMITENLQRKDVDPIEEAFAFGQLIDRGDTAEEVALRFGKSIRFVQDRIKLNSLIPELMLAIRDGKMPISAGMLISKLDDEQQRAYYKQYSSGDNLTKLSADSFVNRLFMTLRYAPWMQGGEPGFEGSCGKRCAQCLLNTANHGCLFYEMKGDEIGKCTDGSKFEAKSYDYAIHSVKVNDSRLVKSGEGLVKGKMVVGIDMPSWMRDTERGPLEKMTEEVKALGYEVVNPSEYFGGQCFYKEDDERISEKLESGECYKVFSLFQHTGIHPRELAYYIKKGDTKTNCASDGTPKQVTDLINEYNRTSNIEYTLLIDGCKSTLAGSAKPTINALSDIEKKALCQLVLHFAKKLRKEYGLNEMTKREDVKELIDSKTDLDLFLNSCLRGFLQFHIGQLDNPIIHELEKSIPDLCKQWCPDEYKKSQDAVYAKRDKKLAKITKQLSDLGYSPSGKKLIKPKTLTHEDLKKQYEEMKKKHPDAILLFRVNEFYEIFGEDAVSASKALNLTLTKRADGTELCGFPHHALDTYLPKLVRAGLRAAICEQLEDPKK